MKFDKKTLEVLNNFSLINPSLKFNEGNVLRTMLPLKTVVAKAKVGVEIDKEFCIGELSRFMATLSLFNDPEVEIGEKQCTIQEGDNKLIYTYCEENSIKLPPPSDPKLPSVDVQFTLTVDMMSKLKKALSVLSLSEIGVEGKKGKLYLKAFDSKGAVTDEFKIDIGKTDKNFIVVFKAEYVKLLPYDYEVSISSKGISHFKNDEAEYWIAIEAASSKFQ